MSTMQANIVQLTLNYVWSKSCGVQYLLPQLSDMDRGKVSGLFLDSFKHILHIISDLCEPNYLKIKKTRNTSKFLNHGQSCVCRSHRRHNTYTIVLYRDLNIRLFFLRDAGDDTLLTSALLCWYQLIFLYLPIIWISIFENTVCSHYRF